MMVLLILVILQFAVAVGELMVLRSTQLLYDTSPTLRIVASGFDVDASNIILELRSIGQASLSASKDYTLTKDSNGHGLILNLREKRRWANTTTNSSPIDLILSSVKFVADSNKNLLSSPVIVAKVTTIPRVIGNSSAILYQTNSNELRISGTGLIGSTSINLFFNPPLRKGVAYDIISPYPLVENQVVLRLRQGYRWRELVGPLNVLGIDSGAGWNTFSGDGVTIAMVVTDSDKNILNEVKVFPSAFKLFQQSSNQDHVVIYGYGFKRGMNITFSTDLKYGKDYEINVESISKLVLSFNSTKYWQQLGPLLIKSILIDKKTYAMGRSDDNKYGGIQVAIVMMNPKVVNAWSTGIEVFSGSTPVYQSVGHGQITIWGNGFHWGMIFELSPPLLVDEDYTMDVCSSRRVILTLKNGKKWRNDAGPILVKRVMLDHKKKVITFGNTNNINGEGIQIAMILLDPIILEASKQLSHSSKYYYRETLSKVITISGIGFSTTSSYVKISLEPTSKSSYEVLRVESNTIYLQLKVNQSWLPSWLSFNSQGNKKENQYKGSSIPLLVTAINTGAGKVILKESITIGFIVRDSDPLNEMPLSSLQPTVRPTTSPTDFIIFPPYTNLRSPGWDNNNPMEPLLHPPTPMESMVERTTSDMLHLYNSVIQICGSILLLSVLLFTMIAGYEWFTNRSYVTKRMIDASGHLMVTPSAIYTPSHDAAMHSRHSRNKTKQRWYYHDDVELLSHSHTDNRNNHVAIAIALESKLFRLEKQLHEINSFLILSTMEVIVRNKPVFDTEKLKILRLKGQLSSISTYSNKTMMVTYEYLDVNTEFAEWNRIAIECNALMDQLHYISPFSTSEQGKESFSASICRKSCVGSSKRYLKWIVLISLVVFIALIFIRVIFM